MSSHEPQPECVEFYLTDDDLPPEAMKDCFHPPRQSTPVHCIHCDEEYDSWQIVYRVRVGRDGRVHGKWECPMPGCDGAGFQFDIFPIDENFVPDDDQPQGEWVDCDDEHDEDCTCEECEELRAEIEADLVEWEKKRKADLAAAAEAGITSQVDPPTRAEDPAETQAEADRHRINDALSKLRAPDGRVPLDDLLPEVEGDEPQVMLNARTMMEIEERLGLHGSSS